MLGPEGLWTLTVKRGGESLALWLIPPTTPAGDRAFREGPVVHGMPTVWRNPPALSWTYDQFGDRVFSALRAGGYKLDAAKEWGVSDVVLGSIDEIRRVIGLWIQPPAPDPVAPANKQAFGGGTRRIILRP